MQPPESQELLAKVAATSDYLRVVNNENVTRGFSDHTIG